MPVDGGALRAVVTQGLVHVQRGLVHRAEGGERIQRDGHAGAAQFVDGEKRRRAELGDVRQHRHLHRIDEAPVHRQLGHRFGKNHVGAGFDAGAGAVDRRVHALDGECIRARHDHEIRVAAGIDRRLDAIDHLLFGNQFLVRTVAAALGADLVLDVHRGGAELDQRLDGSRDVERAGAEAGVDIDQQRQRADVRDPAHIRQDVVERRDTEVRDAQRSGGDAAPGEIDRLEAGFFREDRVVGADRARHLQGLLRANRSAEPCTGGGHRHRVTCGRVSPKATPRRRALPRVP